MKSGTSFVWYRLSDLCDLEKTAIAQYFIDGLPQIKRRVVQVVLIALELRQEISISFVSLHDVFRSFNSRENFRKGKLCKAMLEIIFFLVFFHALELLTESAIDVIEISANVSHLCITALLVQNHPKVEAQIAVTPFIDDRLFKSFNIF